MAVSGQDGWGEYVTVRQVQKLQAAGFEGSSPRAPADGAASTPGILFAEIASAAGCLELTLLPSLSLCNDLPSPLSCQMQSPQALSFGSADSRLFILPGRDTAINCTWTPDESLQLQLGSSQVQATDTLGACTPFQQRFKHKWPALKSSYVSNLLGSSHVWTLSCRQQMSVGLYHWQ